MDFGIADMITQGARWRPDAPALVLGDVTLSWAHFEDAVFGTAEQLMAQGVEPGDRVAVMSRNSIEMVVVHYALAAFGAIMVPINIWLRRTEIAYILGDSDPRLVLTTPEYLSLVTEGVEDIGSVPSLLDLPDTVGLGQYLEESGTRAAEARARVRPTGGWDSTHMILYTSGTTGDPKGVEISQRRTMIDNLTINATYRIRRHERFLCYLPLFHTGGWDYVKMFFSAGGTVVLMDHFDADEALRLIQLHQINATFGVPLVLSDLMNSPQFASADLSSLRLIAYGAQDPTEIMAEVRTAFESRGAGSEATGLDLIHIYGLTEGGPFVAALPPEYSAASPESIGFPVPGVQVSLQDDDGHEVPDGEPGEICVKSPAVMTRYWRNPDATAAVFRNGWMLTGDMAFYGKDGLLYVVDRKKQTIRSAGENVYPKDVERAILTHPLVRDVAVFGVADDRWDERVVAVVELSPGSELTLEELRDYLRPRLASFKCPRSLEVVDKIPKTDVGKTAKGVLREKYGASASFSRQKAKQGGAGQGADVSKNAAEAAL